jgi:hypothetical protein
MTVLVYAVVAAIPTNPLEPSKLDALKSLEVQTELLAALLRAAPNEISSIALSRGLSHNISNVIGMATPLLGNEKFWILLEDDITPESIEFILAFTGISPEEVIIDQMVSFQPQYLVPTDFEIEDYSSRTIFGGTAN